MENTIKKLLPVTILISSIILGGFYYAVEISKQKSEERQLEMQIAEEQRIAAEEAAKEDEVALQKSLCVTEAETSAIAQYRDFCSQSSYCTYTEGTYLVGNYETAYSRCLQRAGLE